MDNRMRIALLLVVLAMLLTGCVIRVPTSQVAREKLENAGYTVSVDKIAGSETGDNGEQVILLNAEKDGINVLQVYFFTSKQDTDHFFKDHSLDLRSNVEAFHKFGYVICRGTSDAMAEFLS